MTTSLLGNRDTLIGALNDISSVTTPKECTRNSKHFANNTFEENQSITIDITAMSNTSFPHCNNYFDIAKAKYSHFLIFDG